LLPQLAEDCAEILGQKNGLDAVIEVVAGSLPEHLRETAYALACDIAATDGRLNPEEIRLLEFLRHRLDVDRLTAAAIERGARARHATL
jgi:tellurite resistance protein